MIDIKNKKKLLRGTEFNSSEHGKLPPQATDLEEAVLGAALLEKEAMAIVMEILCREAFYKEQNGRIFEAMLTLSKQNNVIDILTVTQELKRSGELELVGGAYYVSSLTNRIASSANIEFHARIVAQKYLQRELIRIGTETIKTSYEDSADAFEIQEDAIKSLSSLADFATNQKSFDTISLMADKFMGDLLKIKNKEIEPSIPFGISELDTYGGKHKSDLIIVAARPGMGKTAFLVTCIRHTAIQLNKPCGLFSLEMSNLQLLRRIASAECNIDGERLRKGELTEEEFTRINDRVYELRKSPIYMDDTARIDIDLLCSKAKKMKRLHAIEELYVDYHGLITTKMYQNDKTNSTGYISNRLKALAKELEIPVIDLSQLNRDLEKRSVSDRMPQLSDLRSSGELEQDADQIYFLFRPEYYDVKTFIMDNQQINIVGRGFVQLAKNRHGSLGTELLGFKKETTEFYSLNQSPKLDNNNEFFNNA